MKLLPESGSAGVGWESGNMGWWQIDAGAVIDRACLFDDVYAFGEDGSFANQMGGSTWIEQWQGATAEGCGTPVASHDGSGQATYTLDEDAGTITLNGVGAHIGVAKVISDGNELTNPNNAPQSITYKIMENTDNSMTLEVAYTGGFWTFKLVTLDYVAPEPEEPNLSENSRIEAENWTRVIAQPAGEVVLENTSDTGGGNNIGYIDYGDWMEYDFTIADAGNYELALRVASQYGSSLASKVLLDDVFVDQVAVPNTGGWQNWQTVSVQ